MSTAVTSARGVSRGVVVAAVATAVGAMPTVLGFSQDSVPTAAVYSAGWPAFGAVAALLLDGDRASRVGRVLTALALVPPVVLALAAVGSRPIWDQCEFVWQRLGVPLVVGAAVAVAASIGYRPGRVARRRLFWLVVWSAALVAVVSLARAAAEPPTAAVVVALGLWGLAGLVARLVCATELRPVDEPLVDLAAALLTVTIGAAVGSLVRAAGTRATLPAPDEVAAAAAVIAAALAWPVASWARHWWLQRRYGAGTLTPGDVVAITADLHRLSDPRELLGKAADMVAASTGHREVRLVLGAQDPDCPSGWVQRLLLVGGDRVGTLLLDAGDPEGPEPRQERIVERLLPTVALVSRAVTLAVEAEHARLDVARERDAERARILGDLHDGLGPVLAGMSMRVQAELRRDPTPLLYALSTELAESRGDLRRIVSDLTPSALHDSGLGEALHRLVRSFDGDGRTVALDIAVEPELPPAVSVAVYRSVAEGITNALRHGPARNVTVGVRSSEAGRVCIDVRDDGTGGPIVAGTGLTSLRRRAELLGGWLDVGPAPDGGVLLHVELPARGAA